MVLAATPPIPILTSAQMRAAEQRAFAAGLNSFEALRRAGRAVERTILSDWTKPRVDRVLVLCGPGNNGGDGYIVAAALKSRGWPVSVALLYPSLSPSGDAAKAAALWDGGCAPSMLDVIRALSARSIIIDALFGIGLVRPLDKAACDVVAAVNESPAAVIAVDIPSGISADSGDVMGAAIRADTTVTFGWPKFGHVLQPGAGYCGELRIADLGFGADVLSGLDVGSHVNAPMLWAHDYRSAGPDDHKYNRGHALIIGGAIMTGAARLAARAARRTGLGMLTMVVPQAVSNLYALDQPGAIVRTLSSNAALSEMAGERRITSALVGCGLEPGEDTREKVAAIMSLGKPTVIDGGGLTAFAEDTAGFLKLGRGDVVLTPHEGEFARLFGDDLPGNKVQLALAAAQRSRCVLVLKGADTVVASPAGHTVVNTGAPATLATAGSGDVLAGIVLGLLGQGMPAFSAACMAVWLHSQAARLVGAGLIAEDLPEKLGQVMVDTLRAMPGS